MSGDRGEWWRCSEIGKMHVGPHGSSIGEPERRLMAVEHPKLREEPEQGEIYYP